MGHFGADHWVEGRPTEEGQGAVLDLSAARRKPELFAAGECLAEGPRQTLQTMLHETVHALAHARGVKDTSRGGKYHNKREFVALAGELGLAWPDGQRPHPVIGFSEVTLTEPTLADYADTLAYLGAAIRLYRDTVRRLGLLGGQSQGKSQGGQDGDGQSTGKTSERFKVACGCQPPRSFWIRAKQFTPGPISCGVCGQDFQPLDIASRHHQQGGQLPRAGAVNRRRGSRPGPGRPGPRPARAQAPAGARQACLADAEPTPPARRP